MMLRARSTVVACAVLALALAAPPVRAAPDDNSRYERIAESYFDASFEANPVNATFQGVHTFDDKLGSVGSSDMAAQLARDRFVLDALKILDPARLSPEVALDRQMLENSLEDDLLLNGKMQLWKHQPDTYVQLISGGPFSLISREFAPLAVRMRAVIARENAVPRLVAQAKANLTTVDHESATLAVDDAAGAAAFVADTVPPVFAKSGTAADKAALRRSTRVAVAATKDFAAYIKRHFVAHPAGTYAIGAANYSARLKYEEGIDMPLDEYLAIGARALADTRAQMVATSKLIDPDASVAAVVKSVLRVHPRGAQLMPAAQADLVRLRRFIATHHIIDLPADGNIRVTETPQFLRQTTVASMDAPGPLEKVATRAYYNVTPVDPRDSKAAQEAYLETFNDYERPIFSAHEVYPGHYTQYIINKHQALSLTKKLVGSLSFIEGWAHYDEQMMVDEGWGNGDPRVRLMQLKEAILRNARYVAGVKLHTQGMTLAQAEKFFRTQAFLDPADSRIESRRGTQDATYGYYTLGKLEILKLRVDYKKKLGASFTLAKFHAALLAHGSPPIPLLRPLLLGDADDGVLLDPAG